jgi:hypothetical protein
MYGIKQGQHHEHLRTLSRDVARGMIQAADNGGWLGCPPYAYRLDGPKYNRRLVVGDVSKVRVVQRIYRQYVHEGLSLREIAARLNRDGIPTPGGRGKAWRYNVVGGLIANPAYAGDCVTEKSTTGKYSTIREATVVQSDGKHNRPRAEWRVRRDHHEPIIDRATWDAAQAILARGKAERSRWHEGQEPAYFTCRLRCGKCGALLYAVNDKRSKYYECSVMRQQGTAACPGTTVKEDLLLVSLAEHLESWLGLEGANLEVAAFHGWLTERDELPAVFHEVRNLIAPPPPNPPQDRQRLAKHAASLKVDIDRARGNLVLPESRPRHRAGKN